MNGLMPFARETCNARLRRFSNPYTATSAMAALGLLVIGLTWQTNNPGGQNQTHNVAPVRYVAAKVTVSEVGRGRLVVAIQLEEGWEISTRNPELIHPTQIHLQLPDGVSKTGDFELLTPYRTMEVMGQEVELLSGLIEWQVDVEIDASIRVLDYSTVIIGQIWCAPRNDYIMFPESHPFVAFFDVRAGVYDPGRQQINGLSVVRQE